MNLASLTEEEKQLVRHDVDIRRLELQRAIDRLIFLPVTTHSSHNHLHGAVTHLRQAITDLDYYTRVL